MVLLILYFVPFDLLTPEEGFDAISDKLFVSPVVRTLVFTKANRAEVPPTPPPWNSLISTTFLKFLRLSPHDPKCPQTDALDSFHPPCNCMHGLFARNDYKKNVLT